MATSDARHAPVTRTTPGMRLMLRVAAGLVLTIGLPVYLLPDRTDLLFSWTVAPPITAAFLGGAYVTSMVVEYLASRERIWANARVAVPAVLLFTTLTSIVTLRHLDAFHLGAEHALLPRAVAWVWLVVYLVVPPVLAAIWFRQSREPGADPVRSAPLPSTVRGVLVVQAAGMTLLGVALYLAPESVAEAVWPWRLSALTGGAVGAWLTAIGIGVLHALLENDLRRVRVWMIAFLFFGVAQLVAVLRLAGDAFDDGAAVLDWSGPGIWAYLLVLGSIIAVSTTCLARTQGVDVDAAAAERQANRT